MKKGKTKIEGPLGVELRKFKMAVEQSPGIIVITDSNGDIEYVNPKFTRVTGYSSKEVLGKNPRVLKSGYQSDDFYKQLWVTISSGNEWRGEFCNKKKDGGLYWESASISPIKDESGAITHFVAAKEDVTERKRVEEKLAWLASFPVLDPNAIIETDKEGNLHYINPPARIEFPDLIDKNKKHVIIKKLLWTIDMMKEGGKKGAVVEEELAGKSYELHCSHIKDSGHMRAYIIDITERKRVEKLKDEFISNVSHELRTPLTAIKNAISNMLEGVTGVINEKQVRYLDMTQRNVDRLGFLINDLLDISRIESKKLRLERKMVDLAALVDNIIISFQPSAEKKQISIKSQVPRGSKPVYADYERLGQIFMNLIGNAIKFTPDKGSVVITAKEHGNYIEVCVKDTGLGISRANLEKIFDRFAQVGKKFGEKFAGTGLGLSITKSLVELHGGNIWVLSEEGYGTEFVFTTPIYDNRNALKEIIKGVIKEGGGPNTNISVVRIKPNNIDGLVAAGGCKSVNSFLHQLIGVIRKNVRRDTEFFTNSETHEISLIIKEANKLDAAPVVQRIKDAVSAMGREILQNLEFYINVYPDESKSAEELVEREGTLV